MSFKEGDWVKPTFGYWSLREHTAYRVYKLSRVTHLGARDYGELRLAIHDDRGLLRKYNPKNFKMVQVPVSAVTYKPLSSRLAVIGDRVTFSDGPGAAVYDIKSINYNAQTFVIKKDGLFNHFSLSAPNIFYAVDDPYNLPYIRKDEFIEMPNYNAVKAKSRYIVVDSTSGTVVASSGEKDPHFNEWTDETLKEWLQEEVSSRLRQNPGAKYDVYSFEMQGKLPSITVFWESK